MGWLVVSLVILTLLAHAYEGMLRILLYVFLFLLLRQVKVVSGISPSFLPLFLSPFLSFSLPPSHFSCFLLPSLLFFLSTLHPSSISFFQFFSLKTCQNSLIFTASMNGRYIDLPYNLCHYTCICSPIISILHQSSTFVSTDETIFTYCDHPKSTAYIMTHPSCCTFYGFGQRYHDLYLSLWYHTEYFHSLKFLCVLLAHPFPCSGIYLQMVTAKAQVKLFKETTGSWNIVEKLGRNL